MFKLHVTSSQFCLYLLKIYHRVTLPTHFHMHIQRHAHTSTHVQSAHKRNGDNQAQEPGPSFDALQACVPLSIFSYVHLVPNVLPRSLCDWLCTSLHLLEEGHNHPIVRFAYLCHMIGKELVFFSFLHLKLFELGVEVAVNH